MNENKLILLIVEDESVIRGDIVSKISSCCDGNTTILEASNGKEALELMDKSVNVVITDIYMPVMNGLELIEVLKKQYPQTIVIVISGYDDFVNVKTAMKLGAIDYILKPVNADVISKLIVSIQKMIEDIDNNDERANLTQLIRSGFNDSDSFYAMLINLGNFHSPTLDKYNEQEYYDKLSSDTFKDKVTTFWKDATELQFIPEPVDNRVLVLIKGASIRNFSDSIFGLFDELVVFFAPTPITIVYEKDSISARDCYFCTHKFRNILDSQIIVCKSQLLDCNAVSHLPKRPNANMLKAKLSHLIDSEKYSEFKSEFIAYFSRPGYYDMPQLIFENMLHEVSFFNSGSFVNRLSQNDANTLNDGISSICALEEEEYNSLLAKVASFICDFYSRFNIITESGDSTVNYLISYIQEHFNAPFSLEEFAKKYSFNSTYLIRLFRNKTGTTPNKYIINLRMEKARQMLENNPELSIKQISELCGYDDQHYFSRLFKAQCGVNPTTYRDNL